VRDKNYYEFLTSVFTYLHSIKMPHSNPTYVVEQIFISACLMVFLIIVLLLISVYKKCLHDLLACSSGIVDVQCNN
jgi:hypothetical protein